MARIVKRAFIFKATVLTRVLDCKVQQTGHIHNTLLIYVHVHNA